MAKAGPGQYRVRGLTIIPRTALAVVLLLGSSCNPPAIKTPPGTPHRPANVLDEPGVTGVSYRFFTLTDDPEDDSVSIRYDWGDGDTSPWSDFVRGDSLVEKVHAWDYPGSYDVKAQARNTSLMVSAWSSALNISVAVMWSRVYGSRKWDEAFSVAQTRDSGFILAGRTQSYGAGGDDVWLVRTDVAGHLPWHRTFGGTEDDCGHSVALTGDGGFIVTGYTKSYGAGESDVWLIRTDSAGNEVWNRTFGGARSDEGYSVIQTGDGGFVIAGNTWSSGAGQSDAWLIKTDAAGSLLWDKTYGGTDQDESRSVVQTGDGGFIVTGGTRSKGAGGWDVWLLKTDAAGNPVWDTTFGGSDDDWGCSVVQTGDGGFAVAGYTGFHSPAESDVWLIRVDDGGHLLWHRIFGGTANDRGYSIAQTADGGFIVTGGTMSSGAGESDVWLIKTDAAGDLTWDRVYGGIGNDEGRSVVQTSDGGFAVAGNTWSFGAGFVDAWLIRTNSKGDTMR
jgi:hypothetical protein